LIITPSRGIATQWLYLRVTHLRWKSSRVRYDKEEMSFVAVAPSQRTLCRRGAQHAIYWIHEAETTTSRESWDGSFDMPQTQQFTRKRSIARGLNAWESHAEYDVLVALFVTNPRNIIERTYVTDAAHLTWDILQLRQLKAKILTLSYHDKLQKVVFKLLFDAKIDELIKRAEIGEIDEVDPETLEEVRQQCLQQSRDITDRWSASDDGLSYVSKLSLELGFDEFEIETSVFEYCQDRIAEIDRSLSYWRPGG
jgi:hypothetical protein